MKDIIPVETIENRILLIRGQKVMLDRDLAELYGVTTRNLKRQVRRNLERFPEEFMFQLTRKERDELVPNWHRFSTLKHSSSLPYAFTEHGVTMLASVLNSPKAVKISIYIIKVFVRLRHILVAHQELAQKFEELEAQVGRHDAVINEILEAIRELMTPVHTEAIGFQP